MAAANNADPSTKKRADPNFVKNLPDFEVSDTSIECQICLENFTSNKNKTGSKLPCGHYFHRECINKWLENQS